MDDVIGTVKTDAHGSESQFFVATKQEWDAMDEEEQEQRLVEAMWESGMVEVFVQENNQ